MREGQEDGVYRAGMMMCECVCLMRAKRDAGQREADRDRGR